LTHFIECFWEYENSETDIEHTIIPDEYFDLIAEFENSKLKHIQLTGVWTRPINVYIPKSTKIIGIRFKLLASEYLFHKELKSILNTTENLPLNFWNLAIYQSDDFEKLVTNISKYIENSSKYLKEIDKRKFKLFELIYNKQNLTVEKLSENVFWSSRQINRYFNQKFGFSLKTFLNIIRCNASYNGISKGNLFPDENFFDQSHFIKEIKKHTGTTPSELAKNKNVRYLQLATKAEK
jgi:AraC-like DNA-binding protein